MSKVNVGQVVYLENPDSRESRRDGEKTITKITPKFVVLDDGIRCRRVDQEKRKDGIIGFEAVGAGSAGYLYISKEECLDQKNWKKFKANASSIEYSNLSKEARKNLITLSKTTIDSPDQVLGEEEINKIFDDLLIEKTLDEALMKKWTMFIIKATTKGVSENDIKGLYV